MIVPPHILEIKKVLRRMRGGSQAFLIESEEGSYVAKFSKNPQGTRTLINECIATKVLQRLGVSTPDLVILRLTEKVRNEADLCFQISGRRIPVEPGLHLGSRCPVDPLKKSVFDFMPRKLLSNVINLSDFGTAFVVDKLLGNTDRRQAIFVRERNAGGNLAFRAYCIDHGLAFAGSRWEIFDWPGNGHYIDKDVYSMFNMHAVCAAALEGLAKINEDDWLSFSAEIPETWFSDEDYDVLVTLFATVQMRIGNLESILSRHVLGLKLGIPQAIDNETGPDGDIQGEVLPAIC